jgi:hypothetical protein
MKNQYGSEFEVLKTQKDGKLAFEMIVRDCQLTPGLTEVLESLGYTNTVDMMARKSVFVTNPEEMNQKLDPLVKFFK